MNKAYRNKNTLYLFVQKVESNARALLCPCLTTFSTYHLIIIPSMNSCQLSMNTSTSFFFTQYWKLRKSSSWNRYHGSSNCFLWFRMTLLAKNASLPILTTSTWVFYVESIRTCLFCISLGETPIKMRDPIQCFTHFDNCIWWSCCWCIIVGSMRSWQGNPFFPHTKIIHKWWVIDVVYLAQF